VRKRVGNASARLVWIPLVTLSLFCATGLASHLGWIPNPIGLGDRPAARVARTSLHEPAPATIRTAQAISMGLPAVSCPECEVTRPIGLLGGLGESGVAAAVGLYDIGAAPPQPRTSGDDRHAQFIAWHVCVRSEVACD
jgi:hypothetical protein